VSVASANTYFESYYQNDAWDEITDATSNTASSRVEKESLLIQATREIDNTFRFFQSKYNSGLQGATDYQNLEFPRSGNINNDGEIYIIPEVKEATYQQAIWIKLRRNRRTAEDGTISELPFIAPESFNYIKKWINRQVTGQGTYPWQGSTY
jgi:hypothetical protein